MATVPPTSEFLPNDTAIGITNVLRYPNPWHEVTNITKTAIPNGTHHVESFVDPMAGSKNVIARIVPVVAQESATLHITGNIDVGQMQHGRTEINQTDQLIVHTSGTSLPIHTKLLRNTDDQENVRTES